MRLWIWQVHIKNALTHLSHVISHYFYWKKVGSENFSHPYAMFQFINTGRSDLISFLSFDNYIQHLWYSCFSLQAPFTLIVRSLYCIPECFLTNGISALFSTWSFLLSKSQITYNIFQYFTTECQQQSVMSNFISISFTVWNIWLFDPQNFVLHLSVFSHKWRTCI